MTQSNPKVSLGTVERDQAIAHLEVILSADPDNKIAARKLLSLLDYHMPLQCDLGAYTACQRRIASRYNTEDWARELLNTATAAEHYRGWEATLAGLQINPQVPINQLFVGDFVKIYGRQAYCDHHMALFERENVISGICHSCFKVQILAADLLALVQTYFIFLRLKFPRDNARKCMIELREVSWYPYKGYIYCETEEEAKRCMAEFESHARVISSKVVCHISHGCSEFGLEYPGFKYSADGGHRSFVRPAAWDNKEAAYFAEAKINEPDRLDNNKRIITLRDVITIRTWIRYAEMIGDETYKVFSDRPFADLPEAFTTRVGKQAALRKAQLQDLRKSIETV